MKVTINLEKRYAYIIIGLLVFSAGILLVNALTPGEIPNPGHNIQRIGPPADCEDGQVLQFIDEDWSCINLPSAIDSPPTCAEGQVLSYDSNGWKCVNLLSGTCSPSVSCYGGQALTYTGSWGCVSIPADTDTWRPRGSSVYSISVSGKSVLATSAPSGTPRAGYLVN